MGVVCLECSQDAKMVEEREVEADVGMPDLSAIGFELLCEFHLTRQSLADLNEPVRIPKLTLA